MNKALAFLNNEEIDLIIRVSIFHFMFGYIHPFYDGNGRTSRFISSYLLSKEFESLIAYRLSYSIKENIKEYYGAFNTCNNIHNRGDLTPFLLMFIDILCESMHQLENALIKRNEQFKHYRSCMQYLPFGTNEKYLRVYYLLIQASLFSENGISTQELMDVLKTCRKTVSNRLNDIAEHGLLIKKSEGNIRRYSLNLDEADRIYENKKNDYNLITKG